jgi:methyl-accepting chemotaxis protein
MKTKILLSLVPMIICSLLVSIFIYRTGLVEDKDFERAVAITDTVAMQELQMVSMSEALRGYILDPKNTKELERKKKADADYASFAAKLATMTSENKMIFDLNSQMAKLDEEELDKAENTLAEMVNEDKVKVLNYFSNTYSPIRAKQNANFQKLKSLSSAYSAQLISNINKKKQFESIMTIIFVLSGTLIGTIIVYFVNESVNKLTSKVFNEIYTLSDRLTSTANDLSNKSRELSEATTEEAAAIQETAASLHEVTAMVQRNTENAGKSRDLSRMSRDASHHGLESVKKMKDAMEEIQKTQSNIISSVDEGNKKIGEIVGVISAIGDKTKIINDIVFQTKLLSFNASVEAARAGEQGKGFAVVAEEVGNLAQMSGKASQEISEMLDQSIQRVTLIVDETKVNVEKIVYLGKEKITNGTSIAIDCARSLEDVVSKIEEVNRTIDEISIASNEQSQGISGINAAVGQLDSTTQQNSEIATQTFESSKELSDQSNHLRNMVDSLVIIFKGKNA